MVSLMHINSETGERSTSDAQSGPREAPRRTAYSIAPQDSVRQTRQSALWDAEDIPRDLSHEYASLHVAQLAAPLARKHRGYFYGIHGNRCFWDFHVFNFGKSMCVSLYIHVCFIDALVFVSIFPSVSDFQICQMYKQEDKE